MTYYQLPAAGSTRYLQLALRPGGSGLVACWGDQSGPFTAAAFDAPGVPPVWSTTGELMHLAPDGEWVSARDEGAGQITATRVGARKPVAVMSRYADETNVWSAVAPGGSAAVAWKEKMHTVIHALPGGNLMARVKSGWGSGLQFSPGGRWLTEMGDRAFRVFDRADGYKVFARIATSGHVLADVADDGTTAISDRKRDGVAVYDLPAKSPVAVLPVGGWVSALAVSPDGRRVLTGNTDGEVTLWDADGTRPRRYDWGVGTPIAATFSRDGTCAAVGGTGGRVAVFDLDD